MMQFYHFDLAGQGEVGPDELRAKHQSQPKPSEWMRRAGSYLQSAARKCHS